MGRWTDLGRSEEVSAVSHHFGYQVTQGHIFPFTSTAVDLTENNNFFYGRLRLICSSLRASKCAVLKLIEIVILWVYYHPFKLMLLSALLGYHLQLFQLLSLAKDP